ncbi:MAG: SprT-like domain-containing protein [Muribaculaceae bacterium]|nr:SprT-like domain-containing protein [Muribaculaceae bacterium]
MIPDLNFIRQTFHLYNRDIFSSKLPEPTFSLTRARTFRGKLIYKIRKTLLKTEFYDFEMRFSVNFDITQSEWEDVVIHEMIHLFIASEGIKDRSSHGPEFRKLMHTINKTHGRKIRISTKSTAREATDNNTDRRIKAHFICLARLNDGRLGVAPVAKTRIFNLWNGFNSFSGVKSLKWIGTTDPWFNALPHVQKPKFYLINEEEVSAHLRGAQPLERKGDIIRVVNRRCTPDELLP